MKCPVICGLSDPREHCVPEVLGRRPSSSSSSSSSGNARLRRWFRRSRAQSPRSS